MSQIVCVQAEAGLTVLYSSAIPTNEMLVGGEGGMGGGGTLCTVQYLVFHRWKVGEGLGLKYS